MFGVFIVSADAGTLLYHKALRPWFGLPVSSPFGTSDGNECSECTVEHTNEMKLGSLFFAMQTFAGGISDGLHATLPLSWIDTDNIQVIFHRRGDEVVPLLTVMIAPRSIHKSIIVQYMDGITGAFLTQFQQKLLSSGAVTGRFHRFTLPLISYTENVLREQLSRLQQLFCEYNPMICKAGWVMVLHNDSDSIATASKACDDAVRQPIPPTNIDTTTVSTVVDVTVSCGVKEATTTTTSTHTLALQSNPKRRWWHVFKRSKKTGDTVQITAAKPPSSDAASSAQTSCVPHPTRHHTCTLVKLREKEEHDWLPEHLNHTSITASSLPIMISSEAVATTELNKEVMTLYEHRPTLHSHASTQPSAVLKRVQDVCDAALKLRGGVDGEGNGCWSIVDMSVDSVEHRYVGLFTPDWCNSVAVIFPLPLEFNSDDNPTTLSSIVTPQLTTTLSVVCMLFDGIVRCDRTVKRKLPIAQ